jgi:hypothetical protein
MKTTENIEKIYRVWSNLHEDELAVRIQYSVQDAGSTRLFVLGAREEWL